MRSYKIAIADDQILVRKGLIKLLVSKGHQIVQEASNGQELIEGLSTTNPDIVLMDINLVSLDGVAATRWISDVMPEIKVIGLSSLKDGSTVTRMMDAGAKAYLLKSSEPEELDSALEEVMSKGFYHSALVQTHLSDPRNAERSLYDRLSERERVFLKWACSEMSYKEIADEMGVSPRTVDGYRDSLFEKLRVRTRVGIVIYAVRHGLVRF